MSLGLEILTLKRELRREKARADSLQAMLHAVLVGQHPKAQEDRACPRRVRAKPWAMAWAAIHPGVPLPPTAPVPQGFDPSFPELRLRARRWVYFIQAGDAGAIKIGISRDVERRRGELQRMEREPLHVRATIEGTVRDERDLHARFAAHRIHGEWFTPAPELLSHIAALNGVKQ